MPRKFDVPSVKKFLFPIIIALFILTTINIAFQLMVEVYATQYTTLDTSEKAWMIAATYISGITFSILDKALLDKILVTFTVVNAFANVLMTLLIVSRVWWISRALQMECTSGLKPAGSQQRWYHRTIAIIVESGVIYPILLIVDGGLTLQNSTCLGVVSIGLAPTLIAVQVGLGSAYDNQSLSKMGLLAIEFSSCADSQRATDNVLDEALMPSRSITEDAGPSSVEDAHGNLTEVV
ncbi:hypothetical protein GYMLUDRAFT_241331 [Collybiopsis luxurians FD-317 M1]|uniref:Uncharacterized protein n=1 Tax=Collybiopsis luxurians FD-317 M1 TaxID=944289 RepID=A0A0D0CWD6_9AGAR|nr:hypothetical protein GYMLUDRAFT_241331 [Collybiopsis luxurians FD-317 M1]